jgi:hypothetical protein
MLMIIFGAGASYDSAPSFRIPTPRSEFIGRGTTVLHAGPWRPPLANDLFRDQDGAFGSIVDKYPKLAQILPYLREYGSDRSVEQILESLQEEGKQSSERIRALMAVRFYLCELFSDITDKWTARTNGVTNYAAIVAEALRLNRSGQPIALVTFNYDALLERALYSLDFGMRSPDEYLDSHLILKVFRLHGFVNWARLVGSARGARMTPQQLIDRAETIGLSDRFVQATATVPAQMHNFEAPIVPAIAIPVQRKSIEQFECPRSHLAALEEMLPHVTKILIVGWQGKEAHFISMLRNRLPKLARIMCVGANADDARATLKFFSEEIGLHVANSIPAQGGFTDFVVARQWESFLNS